MCHETKLSHSWYMVDWNLNTLSYNMIYYLFGCVKNHTQQYCCSASFALLSCNPYQLHFESATAQHCQTVGVGRSIQISVLSIPRWVLVSDGYKRDEIDIFCYGVSSISSANHLYFFMEVLWSQRLSQSLCAALLSTSHSAHSGSLSSMTMAEYNNSFVYLLKEH